MVFSFQGTSESLRLIETLYWRLQSISKSNKWIRLNGWYSASPRVIVHMLPFVYSSTEKYWWAKVDSNHRPHDYQSCALASWAIGPFWVVEISGIEPLTSCLQGRRSPSWAKPPSSRASQNRSAPSKLNNKKPIKALCTDLRTLPNLLQIGSSP